jgi:Tol biopolymer transport system component/DNA-binding winged helix-turn-helix (wHTH) protein
MLKSHRNLLEPRPSERLRIGDRVVDIPLREIAPAAGGDAMRVTLKSLGVLLVLVAHAGRPVGREALLEWVWPDTLPTDDVVTQAITQLRKALGDDRERPRYIETLAKQGYRLIAPIEWLDVVEAPPADAVAPASPTPASPTRASPAAAPGRAARRTWAAIDAVGVLALAAALAGAWWWQRDARAPAAAAAAPATAAPVAAPVDVQRVATSRFSEDAPALSPDGALLVYTRGVEGDDHAGSVLMLQTAAAVTPRALTEPAPGRRDLLPAWSPDGREIAFVRQTGDTCRVMRIPATGGTPREIGDCLAGAADIAWFPDGQSLVGGGGESGARQLHRMRIDEGTWRPIPYTRSDEDIDLHPRVSPDGRWIVFQRNLSLGDLWRIPAAGGTPQRLTTLRTNLFGVAWTRDSAGLVYARYTSEGATLVHQRLADGATAEYRLPGNGLTAPATSLHGDSVVFAIQQGESRLRALRLQDGERALARSEALFPSTRSDLLPAVSPDGRQILFISDRDGAMRLWWADLTRPDSLRALDGFEPMARFVPVWSADSERALVIADHPDGRKTALEIEPRQGRVRTLPVPDAVPVHIAYHPDPRRLLVVAERESGRLGLTLYDRTTTPWRPLAQVADAILAVPDPAARRIVFIRPLKPELWQTDLDLGAARHIDDVGEQARTRTLVPRPDGLRVLDATPACAWLWRRVAGGAGPADAHCLGQGDRRLSGVDLLASPPRVLIAAWDTSNMDIGLLPLSAMPLPPLSTPAAASR